MTPTEAHAHAMATLCLVVDAVRDGVVEGAPVDGCLGYVTHNARRLAEESFADVSDRLAKALDRVRTLELVVSSQAEELK